MNYSNLPIVKKRDHTISEFAWVNFNLKEILESQEKKFKEVEPAEIIEIMDSWKYKVSGEDVKTIFTKQSYSMVVENAFAPSNWRIYDMTVLMSLANAVDIIRRQYIEAAIKYKFFGYLPKEIIVRKLAEVVLIKIPALNKPFTKQELETFASTRAGQVIHKILQNFSLDIANVVYTKTPQSKEQLIISTTLARAKNTLNKTPQLI